MFKSSMIYGQFEEGEVSGILLGDSGYACHHFLMTPLLNPQTRADFNFNRSHKVTRSLVERSFGIRKEKFQCLRKGLSLKLETTTTVIVATTVLYNIARRANDAEIEDLPPIKLFQL
ncbi:hypothetical protein L9F63_016817 [Diploptera punctata]|uniref:DDE Tnp4 domain-containing protein n=1 Tax=Diploptera punctata TaxID=6984 RepID=A0AAD8A0V4_DIPPU|nr:hypothetical protein L9F63_016817 [Diploptera punctata]